MEPSKVLPHPDGDDLSIRVEAVSPSGWRSHLHPGGEKVFEPFKIEFPLVFIRNEAVEKENSDDTFLPYWDSDDTFMILS